MTPTSGLLSTISASLTKATPHSDPDLVSLVQTSQTEVGALGEQVFGLKAKIDSYTRATEQSATIALALTSQTVRGPGITITLTDAPPDSLARGAAPNGLVIHQQDIEDVTNALWSDGAEAMTMQDIRVTDRTVIHYIGDVILVNGNSFSPPYVIKTIGGPAQLHKKVNESPRVVNYKTYVTLYSLSWEMTTEDELRLPVVSADSTSSYAQVVDWYDGIAACRTVDDLRKLLPPHNVRGSTGGAFHHRRSHARRLRILTALLDKLSGRRTRRWGDSFLL